ncbi:MAG TPA: alcohol dehydrogenase catalytic domain-containing protein, partial [Solirubrobacteraceae bacterium]
MQAIVLERPGERLRPATLPDPVPEPGQLLLEVAACAVCRTDLHLRDGEIDAPKLPVVLGHQIVGRTEDGRRVGVPWLGYTDGTCHYCTSGRENLCVHARFTGRDIDGGYAELTVADERFCLPLPEDLPDEQLAPLLCGGLIGYRALRMAGD